jgi:hypothetical protein
VVSALLRVARLCWGGAGVSGISGPTSARSQKHEALNRRYRAQIEARLLLEQRLIREGKSDEFRSSIPLLLDLKK